ncbi:MAG: pantoate--beta-alanine ligase [Candidatus Latescibacterota bacterium]|jgi:pantoate--beta-alanine ligase
MPIPELIKTVLAMQKQADLWRLEGQRIALVPTMGYLHAGHLSLVEHAQDHGDHCVVSIFVNPLQFGPQEDLSVYPRDLERDLHLLARYDVDAVFTPQASDFYPPSFSTRVEVDTLTDGLCGRSRPGHFRGVTTVVTKLFTAVKPHVAIFGQKDYQQAAVIRRMVADLNLDVEVSVAPTVRENDGLAMSSRNIRLSEEERRRAPVLYRSLQQARDQIEAGHRDAKQIIHAMRSEIERELRSDIDYIAIVDPETLEERSYIASPVVIALAVRLPTVRLIDNISAIPPER